MFALHCIGFPRTGGRGSVNPRIGGSTTLFHHMMIVLRVSPNGEQQSSNSHFPGAYAVSAITLLNNAQV